MDVIALLIGILGIFGSYYFYKKSIIKAIPVYQFRTFNITSEDNLEIYYKNHQINEIKKTTIVFWNEGRKTINRNDIVEQDKLKFKIKDNSKILSAKIINKSREVNNFNLNINKDKKKAIVDFDFLDFEDFVVVEILHTSTNCSFEGTIKGVPSGIKDYGYYDYKYKKNKVLYIGDIIFTSLMGVTVLIILLKNVNWNNIEWFYILGSISISIPLIILLFIKIYNYRIRKPRFPNELRQ